MSALIQYSSSYHIAIFLLRSFWKSVGRSIIFCLWVYSVVLGSCGSSLTLYNGGDLIPPTLLSIQSSNDQTLALLFDESVTHELSQASVSHGVQIEKIENVRNNTLHISFISPLSPAIEYQITVYVKDKAGNSLLIVESFYGFNNNLPQLLINEFICEGSKNNPDKVELVALTGGSTAGLVLQQGGVVSASKRVFFPDIDVVAGDFIVVHWYPDTSEELINETSDKNSSTHSHAYADTWDIFAQNEEDFGISNTNGSLSLLSLADNTVLDAVVYSVRKDDEEHQYLGFGSFSAYTWAIELFQAEAWLPDSSNDEILLPSDAVNSLASTTTRSVGRDPQHTDTNTRHDWYIANTRKSSFGAINTTDFYDF